MLTAEVGRGGAAPLKPFSEKVDKKATVTGSSGTESDLTNVMFNNTEFQWFGFFSIYW